MFLPCLCLTVIGENKFIPSDCFHGVFSEFDREILLKHTYGENSINFISNK